MTIPADYELVIYPGQKIILKDELAVIGQLSSNGFTDQNVKIRVEEKGLLKVYGQMRATNTEFTGMNIISSNNSNIELYRCIIYDVTGCFITDFNSNITFNNCHSGTVNQLCDFNESVSHFSNCNFKNSDVLVNANASLLNFRETNMENCNTISKLNYNTQFYMWSSTVKNSDTMFQLTNSSTINTYATSFSDFDIGFVLNQNSKHLVGQSAYSIYKTTTQNFKSLEIKS
jgi:hypothetical protein